MVTETKNLQSMSLEELKILKKDWYQKALEDGSLARCYKVCTILGERLNAKYGPKYRFFDDENGLDLYVDDWGNYFTATWKGKPVMSTHPCTHLFIPGEWMDVVNRLYPDAVKQSKKEEEEEESKKRQILMNELTV